MYTIKTFKSPASDSSWPFVANEVDGWNNPIALFKHADGSFSRTLQMPMGTQYQLCFYHTERNKTSPPVRQGKPHAWGLEAGAPTISSGGFVNNFIEGNSNARGPLCPQPNTRGECYINAAMQVLNACQSQFHTASGHHTPSVQALSQLFQNKIDSASFFNKMCEIFNRDLSIAHDAASFVGFVLEDIKQHETLFVDEFAWDSPTIYSCKCQGGEILPTRKSRVVLTSLMHSSGRNLAEDVFLEYDQRLCMKCNKFYACGRTYARYPKYALLKNPDRVYRVHELSPEVYITGHRYKLVGSALHYGGDSSGHYVAVVRFGMDWYLCNDSVINRLASEQEAFSKIAACSRQILLAFERVDNGSSTPIAIQQTITIHNPEHITL